MDIEALRDYCLSKPFATEEMPFGPETLVFKVGGKIFLLVGLDQIDDLRFNVKCDPEYAVDLRSNYPDTVFPGYHMNKKHWNTVCGNRQLSDVRLQDFINDSYDLVYKSLSRVVREGLSESSY
ncbi:MmcQ/YjbR family DNA-binding protein [Sphingobacterium sp. MYb382]|uniref:MmcQ/YjbR family DNA-binding protein n=1 Tax=Sphingobacterium sp. MYb382 TaxID=2745278 RepID=UPI00309675DC